MNSTHSKQEVVEGHHSYAEAAGHDERSDDTQKEEEVRILHSFVAALVVGDMTAGDEKEGSQSGPRDDDYDVDDSSLVVPHEPLVHVAALVEEGWPRCDCHTDWEAVLLRGAAEASPVQ